MDKIYPYETFEDAIADLDNGGKFYNLFSRRGDAKITRAELQTAAVVDGDDRTVFLFFAMALHDLSNERRTRIVSMLADDLREDLDHLRPEVSPPSRIPTHARPGRAYLIEGYGRPRIVESFSIAVVPLSGSPIAIPVFETHTVVDVYDTPDYQGKACLVTIPKSAEIPPEGTRVRWGGLAMRISIGEPAERVHLAARYYSTF